MSPTCPLPNSRIGSGVSLFIYLPPPCQCSTHSRTSSYESWESDNCSRLGVSVENALLVFSKPDLKFPVLSRNSSRVRFSFKKSLKRSLPLTKLSASACEKSRSVSWKTVSLSSSVNSLPNSFCLFRISCLSTKEIFRKLKIN